MENLCGEYVDSHVLYVRVLYLAMDRLFFTRLEDDLHCNLSSSCSSRGDAMADTGKRSMASQPRPGGQGHQYSGKIRANKRHQGTR